MALDWLKIQDKWQNAWEKADLGSASIDKSKDKFFMIFAYPGISGFLHVGHMRGYSYADAICRFERLKGKQVLFPVGTHASGNQALAFARKVQANDKEWIDYLKRNGCPDTMISKLKDHREIIKYFNKVYVHEYWKKFGFICDWKRFTCTTFPDYEKFIQWQFKKLQQKNLLVQKPYFATACVNCGPVAVDPSETDISKGGNAEKNEYTLLKFKLGEDYLVAATLRPETVYGQTNLWVNPVIKYVRVKVEGQQWILSEEAAEKLSYQKDAVVVIGKVDTKYLIGKKALAPGIDKEIIILPASFCDPKVGSGIVTSVPGDAPYDYVALRHLQQSKAECQKYKLDYPMINSIQPIPIIKSKGFGNLPGMEIVEKMQIKSLDDPRLEEATAEVYKAGFHGGVLRENCGKYAGMKVAEAKEMVKAEMLQSGQADIFHDLSEEVVCRCGNKVIIKRIDDQWFIKYSDPELTERSKEQSKEMSVFPEEYHHNLPAVLEWFGDRACVRLGNWLGSKFPFDSKWTIEPISDSTLYPAYYIVSKFVNDGTLKAEELTEEFFDYVFLNRGSGSAKWKKVREEFNYFYPLDFNLGGKEHQTVHFPVFLMNHVAILPEEKWPRGIFVHWWVTGKGSKVSKSKGGAEPIPQAMAKYGVDAMRLYYSHIGSPHVDVVWDEEVVLNYKNALERIYAVVQELQNKKASSTKGHHKLIDGWLESRINQHLLQINESMKEYRLRDLASCTYFTIYDDLRWYLRRGGGNTKVIVTVLELWFKLMNPITPHLSEELHAEAEKEGKVEKVGNKLVSSSSWPEADGNKINHIYDAGEELIQSTVEGMRNVLKLAQVEKPKQFTLFIAESWKYELFTLLSKELKVTHNMSEIMRKVLEVEKMKMRGKDIAAIVQAVVKDPAKLPTLVLSQEQELTTITDALEFLEEEFSCKMKVLSADKSSHPKAKGAMPGKIGVLVE